MIASSFGAPPSVNPHRPADHRRDDRLDTDMVGVPG
jgi:hypothetical protein